MAFITTATDAGCSITAAAEIIFHASAGLLTTELYELIKRAVQCSGWEVQCDWQTKRKWTNIAHHTRVHTLTLCTYTETLVY